MSVKERIEQLAKECPLLCDGEFVAKYPGIADVVLFVYSTFHSQQIREGKIKGKYNFGLGLGVDKIEDFTKLIQEGNPQAIKSYENLRNILKFSSTKPL